jgi:hypothetical protein
MDSFEQYTADMEKFRHTRLATVYPELVAHLKRSLNFVKSEQLEQAFSLTGSEVRQIVQYARRQSIPIVSSAHGYSMARSSGDLDSTLAHLRERMNSLKYTVIKLEQAFLPENDTVDIDDGGVSMEEFFNDMEK